MAREKIVPAKTVAVGDEIHFGIPGRKSTLSLFNTVTKRVSDLMRPVVRNFNRGLREVRTDLTEKVDGVEGRVTKHIEALNDKLAVEEFDRAADDLRLQALRRDMDNVDFLRDHYLDLAGVLDDQVSYGIRNHLEKLYQPSIDEANAAYDALAEAQEKKIENAKRECDAAFENARRAAARNDRSQYNAAVKRFEAADKALYQAETEKPAPLEEACEARDQLMSFVNDAINEALDPIKALRKEARSNAYAAQSRRATLAKRFDNAVAGIATDEAELRALVEAAMSECDKESNALNPSKAEKDELEESFTALVDTWLRKGGPCAFTAGFFDTPDSFIEEEILFPPDHLMDAYISFQNALRPWSRFRKARRQLVDAIEDLEGSFGTSEFTESARRRFGSRSNLEIVDMKKIADTGESIGSDILAVRAAVGFKHQKDLSS